MPQFAQLLGQFGVVFLTLRFDSNCEILVAPAISVEMFGLASAQARARCLPQRRLHRLQREGEKDTKLAQKLGKLQPFMSVFLLECMGQLASFGPT
jgi:hypothetical protein